MTCFPVRALGVALVTLVALPLAPQAAVAGPPAPIALQPGNPHYFSFRGRPTVLVGSGEHYGAVINLDFDFKRYLETLAADGLNFLRLFVGSYVEKPGDFGIAANTLAPAPGRLCVPWARSATPGYKGGGARFDLRQWDAAYFARLRDFVSQAGTRGIVVEVTLFSSFYGSGWELSPLHPGNNVNDTPVLGPASAQTLDNGELLEHQERLVRKVVQELAGCDNVVFELQNEPWADRALRVDEVHPAILDADLTGFGGWKNRVDLADAASLAWQRKIAGFIVDEESSRPTRHLITQNFGNFRYPLAGVDPQVAVLSFHYAWPDAARLNLGLGRVVSNNETGFAGPADETYRRQAWEFLLAGGGAFDHLDYSFAVGHEDGALVPRAPGGGSPALRRQLGVLKRFLEGFDLVQMAPDETVVVSAPGTYVTALAERGRQYALYLRRGGPCRLTLSLPAGSYEATWVGTADGKAVTREALESSGAPVTLASPTYSTDIALALLRR
jgi:hypothetical protein